MRLPEITSQEDLHLRLVPIADVPERNKNTFTGVISRQKKRLLWSCGAPSQISGKLPNGGGNCFLRSFRSFFLFFLSNVKTSRPLKVKQLI